MVIHLLEAHLKSESFIIHILCQQLIQFPYSTCTTLGYVYQALLFTQVYQAYTMILQLKQQLLFHLNPPMAAFFQHLSTLCICCQRDIFLCMLTTDVDNLCNVQTSSRQPRRQEVDEIHRKQGKKNIQTHSGYQPEQCDWILQWL